MEKLIDILNESADLYKNFLELEYKKYDTIIKNDMEELDNIVSKEQVFYLKMRGLEQKREKLMDSMGMKGKTLKEVIESENDYKDALTKEYNELKDIISEVKRISSLCKTLIEVRMRHIDKAKKQLGETENTYSNKDNMNGNSKSLIISRKI